MTITEPKQEQERAQGSRRKWIVAGVALVAVGGTAVYAAGWTGAMGVSTVEVQGATSMDPGQLVTVAGIPKGTPMMRVDLRAATARLSDLPQVASVDVHRQWPRTVVISVSERTPVAIQKASDGWELLDENGAAFAVAPQKPKDLPTVERSPDEPANTAMLQALAGMSQEVRARVASISAESPNRLLLQLRKSQAVVNWGSPEESDYKSAVLSVLLGTDSGWYDVSNPDTPTTADGAPVPATPSPSASPQGSGAPTPATSPEPAAVTASPTTTPAAEAPVGVVPD